MNKFKFKHDVYFNYKAASAGIAKCESDSRLNGCELRGFGNDRIKQGFFDLVANGADALTCVQVECCIVSGAYLGNRGAHKDVGAAGDLDSALQMIECESSAASRPMTVYMIFPAVVQEDQILTLKEVRKLNGRTVEIYA